MKSIQNTKTTHILNRLVPTGRLGMIALLLVLSSGYVQARETAWVDHPYKKAQPGMTAKVQLGEWGESIGRNWSEAQGYKVIDARQGPHGIDILRAKVDKSTGFISKVDVIEVKARTDALVTNSNGLKVVQGGRQMDNRWTRNRLSELTRSSGETGRIAKYALKNMDSPSKVSRQVLSMSVKGNQYVLSNVLDNADGSIRLQQASSGRVTDVLDNLGKHARNPDVARKAIADSKSFKKLQGFVMPSDSAKVRKTTGPKRPIGTPKLRVIGGTAAKVAAPVFVVAEGIHAMNKCSNTESRLRNGELNKTQANIQHSGTLGKFAGVTAGASAGAYGGAQAGAFAGTAICPGIGTTVGGIVGGVAGGVGGAIGGEKTGKWIGEKAAESSKTIQKVAGKAGKKLGQAGDAIKGKTVAAFQWAKGVFN